MGRKGEGRAFAPRFHFNAVFAGYALDLVRYERLRLCHLPAWHRDRRLVYARPAYLHKRRRNDAAQNADERSHRRDELLFQQCGRRGRARERGNPQCGEHLFRQPGYVGAAGRPEGHGQREEQYAVRSDEKDRRADRASEGSVREGKGPLLEPV